MNDKKDGWAGHILLLDMTRQKASAIPTDKYKRWGGGHGLGTALFWDYCEDKTLTDGRDPLNVCVLSASPFCGTLVPSGGGRTEVTGIGTGQWPLSWYTRSNFGGRFSSMMKYGGWDAIVISGKAEHPVWVDIRNGQVAFMDARHMWGKDTHETQKQVWADIGMDKVKSQWKLLRTTIDAGRTTQKSAILSIGPIGENSVHGALIHDAGNGAGQGGFGSVWGSKNLKAISILGTGEVYVADPAGLIQARFITQEKYVDDPDKPDQSGWGGLLGMGPVTIAFEAPPTNKRRPQACQSCIGGCRTRYTNGKHNEQSCQETAWYGAFARRFYKNPTDIGNANLDAAHTAALLGINTYGLNSALPWLEHLYQEGIMGPKGKIKSNLPWDKLGRPEFAKAFLECIAQRTDIGADLADGYMHALHKWEREADLESGEADFPYWGMANHGYDPRSELEWGYGTIMSDRDFNSHDINMHLFWQPFTAAVKGKPMRIEAEKAVGFIAARLGPYAKDRKECFDYRDSNMYSEALAQLVRWHLHYGRFWKNSCGLCDFKWANFFNTNTKDNWGATGSEDAGEQVWWRVVTGEDMTFEDGITRGREIYNLDNAIWTLQGRHRDLCKFAPYIYKKDVEGFNLGMFPFFFWPTPDDNGKWEYREIGSRHLDEAKVEEWKNTFYGLEGWDTNTGWPTRKTLEEMDMAFVADELEAAGKLGVDKS